jgi:Holliday junction resolvasome RuvABC endonuclease subunit
MTPIVVGLDLSLTGSGVASSLGWCERLGRDDVTTKPLDERLALVESLAREILGRVAMQTALVCVELPAFSRSGGGVLERSALWWHVVRRLRQREIPVAEIPIQARMRYATGKGMASKGAVIDAVARRWPMFETAGDDNLADAAVLAAMGADRLGAPIAAVPATHRKAIDGVRWPDPLSAPSRLQHGVADYRSTPKPSETPTEAEALAASILRKTI